MARKKKDGTGTILMLVALLWFFGRKSKGETIAIEVDKTSGGGGSASGVSPAGQDEPSQ